MTVERNENYERKNIEVEPSIWEKETGARKRTHIWNVVLISMVLTCIGENVACNVFPKLAEDLKIYNEQLAQKVKLEDKSKAITIEKLKQQLKASEDTRIVLDKELHPSDKVWEHSWRLKEAEACYAANHILEDFVIQTNANYKIDDCNFYGGSRYSDGTNSYFRSQSISIQREAKALFEKEYNQTAPVPTP